MDARSEMEQALGAEKVQSLAERLLLWELALSAGKGRAGSEVRSDRTLGAVLGLAGGNADAAGAVGVETQTFVLAAEAWLDHGWQAPAALAEQLSRERHTLRTRGQAIDTAVDGRRAGIPWHLAATTSYANGALARAVAVGAVFADDPAAASLAASLDAAVTHADRRATAASAALAAIVAGLIHRQPSADPVEVCRAVALACGEDATRDLLTRALASRGADPATVRGWRWGVRAPETLALAVWCLLTASDAATAAAVAGELEHDSHVAGALAGALAGAIRGAGELPASWHRDVEGAAMYPVLARRLSEAGAAPATPVPPAEPATDGHGSDIWFLLDRSGSMQLIARDVVFGFDRFFAAQRATAGEATVTVVQFDDADRHEVLVDAAPLGSVASIAERFAPRGSTPLYDAIGLLLDRAERHGGDDADQLVVVLTDGAENASGTWTQQRLFARIGALRDRGWTFVFLGANQDSYASGGQVGFLAGNTSNFSPDAAGVHAVYDGLDRTVSEWRGKSRRARRRDRDEFWGGRKEAEER